ncbi:MAG: multidrug ABC transporter ATP-binding protein [Candidatus Nephrothrix sp. EaCA]|nr:MAG: multidrug ABC transporter ATP-binding protein [Candidatus Nephrothrix sp. EaCA]
MPNIIETHQLSFSFSKGKKIVNNLSLNVPVGSIYGFLGPNGAGKTTTMRLLTRVLPDDTNSISLFGKPVREQLPQAFSKIAALLETPALHYHLSGYDNLRCAAKLRGVSCSKIDSTLEMVEMTYAKKQRVKQYSFGMKQRLAIAICLLSEPELLMLDEPVNGLDPAGMRHIRQLLIKINKETGAAIFISSHLLNEMEKMCSHVGIIHLGSLKFEGSISELSKKFIGCAAEFEISEAEKWASRLTALNRAAQHIDENHLLVSLNNKEELPALIKQLAADDARIYKVKVRGGLEEWFISLTK